MNDGVISNDEITRMYEAGELTIEDVRARFGHVIARYLLLAKYAVNKDTGWPRVDYPPKMFISHKWQDGGIACDEALQLAEKLAACGVDVVYDQWWSDQQNKDLEWRISQIAISRTVFFLLTPEYFAHTSIGNGDGAFRASWVEDELQFGYNLYLKQLDETPDIGAVIETTGLLFDSDNRELKSPFSRLFEVSTPERWEKFLATFDGLRVHALSQADQKMISEEARLHAENFVAGHHNEAFSALAKLAARFPFVGDLATMLVNMAKEVGDLERACDVAQLGIQSTEDWRWEHRWLEAQWKSLRNESSGIGLK
jgi:hypothetical protein